MDTTTLRKEIQYLVDKADDHFLHKLYAWVQAEKETSSERLSLKERMNQHALASEKEIENHELISAKQFENDYSNWKKNHKTSTK